jgi:hypothetical protein
MELADLAVDVVIAADYLLSLLHAPDTGSSQLALVSELTLDAVLADVQDELLAPLSPGEGQAVASMLTRVLDCHAGLKTAEPSEARGRARGGFLPGPGPLLLRPRRGPRDNGLHVVVMMRAGTGRLPTEGSAPPGPPG